MKTLMRSGPRTGNITYDSLPTPFPATLWAQPSLTPWETIVDHQHLETSGSVYLKARYLKTETLKTSGNFKKTALNNSVRKEKEQNQAGNVKLRLQNGPSLNHGFHVFSIIRAAQYDLFSLFTQGKRAQERNSKVSLVLLVSCCEISHI